MDEHTSRVNKSLDELKAKEDKYESEMRIEIELQDRVEDLKGRIERSEKFIAILRIQ